MGQTDITYKVTALVWDAATRTPTKPAQYIARNRTEAENWIKCNREYIVSPRIEKIS